MKKILLLFISMIPVTANSADYLDMKIRDLLRVKQERIQELEKCQNVTGGLKIAGITTLGVSTIGIAANIGEAVILKQKEEELQNVKDTKIDLNNQLRLEYLKKAQNKVEVSVDLENDVLSQFSEEHQNVEIEEPLNLTYEYDGTEHDCIQDIKVLFPTPGSGKTVIKEYSIDNENWSETLEVSVKNVSDTTKTIYYKVSFGELATKTGSYTCSVKKGKNPATLSETSVRILKGGTTSFDIQNVLKVSRIDVLSDDFVEVRKEGETLTVTAKDVGSGQIEIKVTGDNNYEDKTLYFDITVVEKEEGSNSKSSAGGNAQKQPNGIKLNEESGTVKISGLPKKVQVTGHVGALSAKSSDESIATVRVSDQNQIVMNGKKEGIVTITVTAEGDDKYKQGTAKYLLTVNKTGEADPNKDFDGVIEADVKNKDQDYEKGKTLTCDIKVTNPASGAYVSYYGPVPKGRLCKEVAASLYENKAPVLKDVKDGKNSKVCARVQAGKQEKFFDFTCQINPVDNPMTLSESQGEVAVGKKIKFKVKDAEGRVIVQSLKTNIASATYAPVTKMVTVTGLGDGKAEIVVTAVPETDSNYKKSDTKIFQVKVGSGDDKPVEEAIQKITVNTNTVTNVYDGAAHSCDGVSVTNPDTNVIKYAKLGSYGNCSSVPESEYSDNVPSVKNVNDTTEICFMVTADGFEDYSGSFKCEITKASNPMKLDKYSSTISVGETAQFTIQDNVGEVTVVAFKTSISLEQDDNNVTISGVESGNATIIVSASGNENYERGTLEHSVTVTEK